MLAVLTCAYLSAMVAQGMTRVIPANPASPVIWARPVPPRLSLARPVCTLRILRADPALDPAMAHGVETDIDSKMVMKSRCAPTPAGAPQR